MPSPSPPVDRSAASQLRVGFAIAASLDALVALGLHDLGPGRVALAAVAFAALHVLALGLVLSAVVGLAVRLLPSRRSYAIAAATGLAFLAGWGVFIDDFSVFPVPVRIALTLGAAAPFGILAACWPRVARSLPLAAIAGLAGLVGIAANHLVLDASYPGVHLATHVAVGLLLSLAIGGLRARARPSTEPRSRPRKLALAGLALAGLAVACLACAFALVVWPSNAVLVALGRLPTASLVPFLARAHPGEGFGGRGLAALQERAWFTSREGQPPRAPTSPPLFAGAPLVVFLTIDALRADVVLGDGALEVASTRNLRALAARGASFTMARSTASSTYPATSSLFFGRYYSSLHWTEQEVRGKVHHFLAKEEARTFPELLAARGVESAFVLTLQGFSPELGITRGMRPLSEKVAAGVDHAMPKLRAWLDAATSRPAMVWAHLLDPHAPYVKGATGDPPYERYLGEVEHVDEALGTLVAHVEAKGLASRVFFVVSADHGEAFDEHATTHHASTVYEEQVRVPLLVVGPGVEARTIAEPVSLIDLGATLLDLFGVETPGDWMGESLVPLLAGRDVQLSRPIVLDAGRRKQGIVSRDGLKAIRNLREKTREVYDLGADPGELENLLDSRPELAEERLDALASFFRVHELQRPGYSVPYRE